MPRFQCRVCEQVLDLSEGVTASMCRCAACGTIMRLIRAAGERVSVAAPSGDAAGTRGGSTIACTTLVQCSTARPPATAPPPRPPQLVAPVRSSDASINAGLAVVRERVFRPPLVAEPDTADALADELLQLAAQAPPPPPRRGVPRRWWTAGAAGFTVVVIVATLLLVLLTGGPKPAHAGGAATAPPPRPGR